MEKSGGFDMSKLSTASKIVLVAGILLVWIDSFLSWQKVCVRLRGVAGLGSICARRTRGAGSGGFLGLIMGILQIVLLIWEGIQLANAPGEHLRSAMTPSQGERRTSGSPSRASGC